VPEGKILMPDESPNPEQENRFADLARQPAELDFSQAEYKRFYANHVATAASLFEIKAIFSSVQGLDPASEKLVVDESMHVRMAPELALALLQQLQKAVSDYVRMFGALRPTKPFPPTTMLSSTVTEQSAPEAERPKRQIRFEENEKSNP